MSTTEPSSIAITDCGSTTTKAILVELKDGDYRQTYRGEAPTTVEAPVEDVTAGVVSAFEELGAVSGRRLVDEQGLIVRPASKSRGVDLYLSTSSAGGG
ncbi:MAG: glutamate mutase L, partial [Deltaproteobacteria bacterium]|nr:glutamate mutase L [Deltaproteobacteria bacterium]